jgi:predicted site-specific integrase-resolvase
MRAEARIDDPIRSLRDVAIRWGVSMDTVRRRVAAGELTVVRLSPRRIGVRASEEERYLREREAAPVGG